MAKFMELIDSLGVAEDGATIYPDGFTDALRSAYDEDFSIPTAKVDVLTSDLANATAEINALKAHNYDLIMQIPAAATGEAAEGEESEGEEDADDDEPQGVDSLFGN